MTLLQITPTQTTELFTLPLPEPHGVPGDQLAGHPHAPRRGEDRSDLAGDSPPIVLSAPIPVDQIDANTPYVIKDNYGRAMCVENAGSGSWDWAYFGAYDSYSADVLPLSFSGNPADAPASLIAQGLNWPLHANGTATSWEYAFWAPSNYSSSNPVTPLAAHLTQTNPDGTQFYRLVWQNSGTPMYLCSDSGSWNWAYLSSSDSSAMFTFHKFYVQQQKLASLFSATWPNSDYDLQVNTGDEYYEAITSGRAMLTYQNSGLAAYNWNDRYFDCDDFSYVYKGQAAKDAYVAKPEYGYAVGIIFGGAPSGGHAVNVFIDTSGTVQVIEPQNGQVVQGQNWKDHNGAAYSPYFILM
ncbi:MAG TPA: lectin MOA-related protein [Pseudonocardiaceae bacterium]|nr:lectin MOA-related protein [Pseudonocardiaceae bacterium]